MKDKSKYPLVSIIIPTFNSSLFIANCVRSVLSTNYSNYEVVMVDDSSTDDTVKIVKLINSKNHHKIRIFVNEKRMLAASTRNKGFLESKGKYVALLDHDTEVDKNWIKEMVKVIEEDGRIGLVQSKIFDIKKRNILQCIGVKIIPQLGWVESIGFGEEDGKKFDDVRDVVGAATGVLYRKSLFNKLSGFDEKLGINVDDLDLNWRFWISGYRTKVAINAHTYHWLKKSKTRDIWLNRFWWEFHYSKIQRVFIKNYSFYNLIRYLPIYYCVSFIRGVINILLRFNFAPMLGLLAGTFWNILYLWDSLKMRNEVQTRRVFTDDFLLNKIFVNKNLIDIFLKLWYPIWKRTGKNIASEGYKT